MLFLTSIHLFDVSQFLDKTSSKTRSIIIKAESKRGDGYPTYLFTTGGRIYACIYDSRLVYTGNYVWLELIRHLSFDPLPSSCERRYRVHANWFLTELTTRKATVR